jgi:hypothetical protein
MPLRALNTHLLPVAALLLLASPALAGWPGDPGVNVPVSRAASAQYFPAIAPDGMGGAVTTWRDYNSSSARVQRLSADGRTLWTTDGVILSTTANMYDYPDVCGDGSGGAIVTWIDGNDYRVRVQRVSAAGTPAWAAGGVALTVTGSQQFPHLVSDGAGGAIVTWFDSRSDYGDIYAQHVSSAGAVQWASEGVALCTAASAQYNPTIATDGAGGAIVTWYDYRAGSWPDIYAQRVSAAGSTQWAVNGVAVCTADSTQIIPTIASDGAGGAIMTWLDYRAYWGRVYAQRLSSAGTPLWTANGVALTTGDSCQIAAKIVPDGAGGAIVAWNKAGVQIIWTHYGIYAQRVSAAGAVQWAPGGVPLCVTTAHEYAEPGIVPDGTGGAIVAWEDARNGNVDLYAQRLNASGTAQWGAGVAVSAAPSSQRYPAVASDDVGGAIITWTDWRNNTTTGTDIYAQRVDRWGCLGAQPTITGVHDVPGDEGGHVAVTWNASPLDSFPAFAIGDYWIWRQVPSALAQSALARGARLLPDGATPADAPRGVLRTTTLGTATFYWELVDSQTAQGLPGYSFVASTTCDSVAAGNPRAVFMVEARGALAGQWWFSDPDSGYSVDNLAPAAPSPFTGEYLAGTTTLHWGVSPAVDFATFRLHRGHDASFVPGPANLVVTKADTGYVDVAGGAYFYRLAAVDLHGNVGPYALLQPSGTVEVPGAGAPRALALSAPAPNPMRGSCSLRLALPREAQVTLAVFDQQGRRVRTLLAGTLPAGEQPLTWDGRDERGRPVASALYFVRLESDGRALTRRLVVVR